MNNWCYLQAIYRELFIWLQCWIRKCKRKSKQREWEREREKEKEFESEAIDKTPKTKLFMKSQYTNTMADWI